MHLQQMFLRVLYIKAANFTSFKILHNILQFITFRNENNNFIIPLMEDNMNTRIWCEFAKPLEVCNTNVLEVFKEHNISLNYRLGYGEDSSDFYKMLENYNRNGIPVSIWATLSDDM